MKIVKKIFEHDIYWQLVIFGHYFTIRRVDR